MPPTLPSVDPIRRLSDDERQVIVDVMHEPEFVDQPPMEVFGELFSQGIYLGIAVQRPREEAPGELGVLSLVLRDASEGSTVSKKRFRWRSTPGSSRRTS
jgi:hypothetical protein